MSRASLLAVGLWLLAGRAAAQDTGRDSVRAQAPRTMKVVPGPHYRAGRLHTAILGEDYRKLWTSEIEVELLDLQRVAGGLRPTQRGGSMQTNSLRFAGANGKEYVFRPSQKDFTKGLQPDLRETLVRDIAQDQVVGYHPAAAVIVARMLDATGIRHPRPVMVVMPDDPALGEFRQEFAGAVGTFEERPGVYFDESPESPGATEVISSERLFERMQRNADNMVDTRAFLSARLFDIFVGDRDRHRDQWRWGRFSGQRRALWEPIPRDRDMPFARFEGLGPWVIRGIVPQLITFGTEYPDMVWLNWNAREIDRRLLVGLERPAWDSLARNLQRQLTDEVIDSALAEMPAPFQALDGQRLRADLFARRERLPAAAGDYYTVLAREVDWRGTDNPDRVDVTRMEDGSVHIALFEADSSGTRRRANDAPFLQRRFHPAETREVRLLLYGGNDRVVLHGANAARILIRVVGGGGVDVVTDSIPGGDGAVRIYDTTAADRGESARAIPVDTRAYAPPAVPRSENAARDWGLWSFAQRTVSYSPTIGLVGGIRHIRYGYGFRSDPFASRSTYALEYSLGERRPRALYDVAVRRSGSKDLFAVRALASGIEFIRFHGLGNESSSDSATAFYRVFQNLFRVEPSWVTMPARGVSLSVGAIAQYAATRDEVRTLVGQTNPYGSESFGQVGAAVSLDVDRRNLPTAPSRGFRVTLTGSVYPALWNVKQAYGDAAMSASTSLSAGGPRPPVLALRAGGQHVFGTFPIHGAAFLGGSSTLRGWDQQRFAGRSSAFGSAELRVVLRKIRLIVPMDVGTMVSADAGRVYADGESSDVWHTGTGGGLWLAPLMRNYTVSLSVVRGVERVGLYARAGFVF